MVLIAKQWRCFSLFYVQVSVSLVEIIYNLERLIGFIASPFTTFFYLPEQAYYYIVCARGVGVFCIHLLLLPPLCVVPATFYQSWLRAWQTI